MVAESRGAGSNEMGLSVKIERIETRNRRSWPRDEHHSMYVG